MKSEWKKLLISEVGEVITGKTPRTKIEENFGGSIPFLTPSDNMSVKYVRETKRTLSRLGLSEVGNKLIPQNAIAVSCIGSDLGKVVITTKETVTNQQINSIVLFTGYDVDYVYYALKILGERLNFLSKTSTAVPIINKTQFSNEILYVPPLPTQKAIADTLSCLDAKIELNNKINENLEAQAQAIFKSWFVDFEPFQDGEFVESELGLIPKGWRVGKLEEIGEITMGQSPKGSTYNELGDGKVFYQGRAEFGWRFPTRRLFTTDPKRMANENDILMSVRAPVGDINIAYEECCIGRGLASIRNAEHTSFLLYTMQAIHQRLNQFNAEGTVFGSINQGELRSMKVIIPPENFICKFEDTVEFCDKEIRNLSYQNTTLAALRDTLLPKLMSGEVEVPVTQ